ncbi:S-adenosylmethionine carrier 1, chloroplastic/mitochondrial-like protein [Tanacetum coccineum]
MVYVGSFMNGDPFRSVSSLLSALVMYVRKLYLFNIICKVTSIRELFEAGAFCTGYVCQKAVSLQHNLQNTFKHKIYSSKDAPKTHVVSISKKADNPFDFVRVLLEGAVAGAAAGVVVEAALYPLDTIKTRLQAVRGGGQIVLKGLYSGLAGNLAGVLPASAIFIGVYEPTKQKLLKSCPENFSALAHLTAGAVGGAASSIIRVPTEVVKQKDQTGHVCLQPLMLFGYCAKEGFKDFLRSFLLRDLPFDAIQFCLYEQLRIGYKLAAKRDLSEEGIWSLGAGNQYRSISHCVGTILKEEGPSAFLKGMGPRVLWIGIGGSIFFGVLERAKLLLAQRRPEDHDSNSGNSAFELKTVRALPGENDAISIEDISPHT